MPTFKVNDVDKTDKFRVGVKVKTQDNNDFEVYTKDSKFALTKDNKFVSAEVQLEVELLTLDGLVENNTDTADFELTMQYEVVDENGNVIAENNKLTEAQSAKSKINYTNTY
ncbi:hypothetical protein [Mulberry dwarf phytoplasma]|uniref:hypothetical protein n=1 Tax=Mulberry dwarf phytoplasma TaxID=186171 RepID=UPI001D105EBD|nr:hypothetical protein [Mulberry dwarf phytoplasma]